MGGSLAGLRIIEMAGLGPAPFAGMMLADHGAEVIRIERPGALDGSGVVGDPRKDILMRSRTIVTVDLKTGAGRAAVERLVDSADGLIEGFRPGVMERLGLGPGDICRRNPRLVYGRMTGWGQTGPLAPAAGHDINYIAISGVLHAIGPADGPPIVPLNLVGDFGGGAMMLAFGMVSALLHAARTGQGQVIDCAMTDGSALLMAMIWQSRALGDWSDARADNMLDGGAPYYGCYETSDSRYVAIGALEERFYRLFVELTGLDEVAPRDGRGNWPALRERLTRLFRTRTRAEWCDLLEGTDMCFAPVLTMEEARSHPHNVLRKTFVEDAGVVQPAPAPRMSATPARAPRMFDGAVKPLEDFLASDPRSGGLAA